MTLREVIVDQYLDKLGETYKEMDSKIVIRKLNQLSRVHNKLIQRNFAQRLKRVEESILNGTEVPRTHF